MDNYRAKFLVYFLTAGATGSIGALISLQKLRISPDAAFNVNDWTAFVIFIVVIGGIGRMTLALPKGIAGLLADRFDFEIFPLRRRVGLDKS